MSVATLTSERLEALLAAFAGLRIAVIGDFFLDAYFDCDRDLDETSLETGRTCYQVVRTRRQAGAAGTVAANLVALGAGSVHAVGFCGDDGEGWELRRALDRLGVDAGGFVTVPGRVTPTYGKPCVVEAEGRGWRVVEELERLDIKNHQRTPQALQDRFVACIDAGVGSWDAVLVVDQVSEAGCGVITPRLRQALRDAAERRPRTLFLADSRQRLRQFHHLGIKPNAREAAQLLGEPEATDLDSAAPQATRLAGRGRRPVFLTVGAAGMVACVDGQARPVPGFPVRDRPVDPVGAGDSTTAALACSLAAGATAVEAATLANLVGSVTVQQVGTTGTAPPAAVLQRWQEVRDGV